jgi:hypothetical protein
MPPVGGERFDIVWAERLPKDADVKKSLIGNYSVDLTDIAPIPSEEWMPPVGSFLYEVTFRDASL